MVLNEIELLAVSIQPTYEELKLVAALLNRVAASRIQPTYEELKRMTQAELTLDVICIQPTYEELKLYSNPPCNIAFKRYPAYL